MKLEPEDYNPEDYLAPDTMEVWNDQPEDAPMMRFPTQFIPNFQYGTIRQQQMDLANNMPPLYHGLIYQAVQFHVNAGVTDRMEAAYIAYVSGHIPGNAIVCPHVYTVYVYVA